MSIFELIFVITERSWNSNYVQKEMGEALQILCILCTPIHLTSLNIGEKMNFNQFNESPETGGKQYISFRIVQRICLQTQLKKLQ